MNVVDDHSIGEDGGDAKQGLGTHCSSTSNHSRLPTMAPGKSIVLCGQAELWDGLARTFGYSIFSWAFRGSNKKARPKIFLLSRDIMTAAHEQLVMIGNIKFSEVSDRFVSKSSMTGLCLNAT
jgi:hypothetical protein